MLKTLLIATRRNEKVKEIKAILKDLNFKIVTLSDIHFPQVEPEEDKSTYKGNAALKARFYGSKSGLLTLADDTGLEVDALPGKLGVRSKRYLKGSDKDRYKKLLEEMKNIPEKKRKACFISAIAFFNPRNGELKTTKGICQGKIAFRAKGIGGFGYDPLFIVDKLGKRNSQLTLTEKNEISSRSKAIRKMRKYLEKYEN